MSTLSFQRPSLLYTPPDLGSPSQKSSAADVAIGTLISFSPWDKEGKEGGGSAPSPPTPVSNSHQSQLFGIGLLWTVLMEMDSSAHGHHLWLCLFFISFFPLLSFYTCYVRVFKFTCFNKMYWMSVNDSIKIFFFLYWKIERLHVCIFF